MGSTKAYLGAVRMDSALGRAAQRLAAASWFARLAPHFVPQVDRFLHKASGGRFMLTDLLMPGVVLTTTGSRSGTSPRATPLLGVPLDGDLYVVGSNYGEERHPAWSSNLIKDPSASVSRSRQDHTVEAHRLTDSREGGGLAPPHRGLAAVQQLHGAQWS